MAKLPDFPCVFHVQFGHGLILGERDLGVGAVKDVFFLDGALRAILPEFLEDGARPAVRPSVLRSAYALYKKAYHVKPPMEEAEPEPKTRDLDEASWHKTYDFAGDEESLATDRHWSPFRAALFPADISSSADRGTAPATLWPSYLLPPTPPDLQHSPIVPEC